MTPSPSQSRILVIEDDPAVRNTLVDILELNGYTVDEAVDGAAGLTAARTQEPSLIITDINMPGLDGFHLLESLRADAALRTVPVIMISARVDRHSTRYGMELGADDFITKPFTEAEVLRSIAARLEKKELLDELDAFSHTVAHDLRNPLSTLIGRLELLQMFVAKTDNETLTRQSKEAVFAARRLNEIIDELLILSGVRRQSITPQPLEMGALINDATDRLGALMTSTGARIEPPCSTWPVAMGHAPWVIEIWVNYLSNAAKYGGEKPQIELGADPIAETSMVRFWVRDHGPGLPANTLAKLFVPFTRIGAVRAEGHGLGLSIVRRIAEKLSGTAGAESLPGQGACFWFELPAAPSASTTPA